MIRDLDPAAIAALEARVDALEAGTLDLTGGTMTGDIDLNNNDLLNVASITGLPWTTFTPALTAVTTNPTLGTGSVQNGRYVQAGKLIRGHGFIRFGTAGTAAGSGTYSVSLPVAAETSFLIANATGGLGSSIGGFHVRDNSAPAWRLGSVQLATTTTAILLLDNTIVVNSGGPWPWAPSDSLTYFFGYERS
jgi:hypothetical protein